MNSKGNKVMIDIPPAMQELLQDPQRYEVEDRMMAHVHAMLSEGIPVRAIARGMIGAVLLVAHQEYLKFGTERLWAKKFIKTTGHTLLRWWQDTEEAEKKVMADKKRQEETVNAATTLQ